jgi:aminopeptidase N
MKHLLIGLVTLVVSAILFTGSSLLPEKGYSTEKQFSEQDNYDVTFYHLDLNVSDTSTFLSGSVTIFIKPITELEEAVFDFSDQLITDSVKVSGNPALHIHESDKLTVRLPGGVTKDVSFPVTIYYHGLGRNSQIDGIYNGYADLWNKKITWTLTEPFSALNFFPCKQSLTDKADSVYIFLSTDRTLKAGSNGILTAEVPLPENRIRYEWKSRFPIAYYLISFSVSDYMDYSYHVKIPGSNDSVLIQNYIYNDSAYLEQNKTSIDKTGDLIVLYSELFGLYPFIKEKYGHCVAPFSGGMEHQTMTTLVNFSFLLVAHELTHQWFGDHITCSTWQDIWINEGFASYGEYLAYQYLTSKVDADNWIASVNNFVKSEPGGSVFVPESFAENEGRLFSSRLSYKKGASIIHMLRQETGNDQIFFDIMRGFVKRYAGKNASGANFRDFVTEKTGKDFVQFFDQWYYGQGYPIHSIRWNQSNDTLYINSLQTTSSETPFFNVLLEFRLTGADIDTIVSFRQDANYSQWQVYMPGNISQIQPDPNHWLLIDLSDISVMDNGELESDFNIVPNPAQDKIRIETSINSPTRKYSLFIANSEGKIILRRESSGPVEEINVSSFAPGMYFVIIKSGRSAIHRKLIIN